MSRNENRQVIAGAFAATAVLAGLIFGTPVAHADPGDTNLGTGSPAAGPNPSDGKGSPSFDVPVSIPEVTGTNPAKPGKDATDEEKAAYATAKAEYERQVSANSNAKGLEAARLQAKKAKAEAQTVQHGNDVTSVPSSPWCPNNADSCPGNR